jgi:hypothetical protein
MTKTKDEILSWLLTHGGVENESSRLLIYNTLCCDSRFKVEQEQQPRKTARQFIIDDNNTFPDAKQQTWEDLEKQNLAYDLYGVERLLEIFAAQFQGKELREELIKFFTWTISHYEGKFFREYYFKSIVDEYLISRF